MIKGKPPLGGCTGSGGGRGRLVNGRLRTSTSLPLPPPLGGAGGTQRPAPQTAEGEASERPLADEHQPPLPLFGGAGRGVYAPSHSRNQAASIEPKGV